MVICHMSYDVCDSKVYNVLHLDTFLYVGADRLYGFACYANQSQLYLFVRLD